MIYYGCPKCGAAMSSPDSMADKFETCPDCGNVAAVPTQPPPQPTPQPGVPTTVQVKPPPRKSDSPLGVASLVMGIFAVLGSCTPGINVISILLAAIGFICGALGLLYALVRRKSATRYPAAGVVVCILAIFISMYTLRPMRGTYPSVGDEVVLRWSDDPKVKVLGAVDLAAYDALMEAADSKDSIARAALLISGRTCLIKPGTRALILDRKASTCKVRLLSGDHAYKVVWIPMEVTR